MMLTFLLCLIACAVTVGLGLKRNVWPLIVSYWLVLTIKYITELLSMA